ncbi:hypothetical protein GQ44DRAFT_776050 [Phaeosphaeriaceae sp. PMI808]|nr:hypothetical protein GQ44DRAFT_776050 [Phaeosphaeriaceae sp. PMI808]
MKISSVFTWCLIGYTVALPANMNPYISKREVTPEEINPNSRPDEVKADYRREALPDEVKANYRQDETEPDCQIYGCL